MMTTHALQLLDFVGLAITLAAFSVVDRFVGVWLGRRENRRHLAEAIAAQKQITNDAMARSERSADAREEKRIALIRGEITADRVSDDDDELAS